MAPSLVRNITGSGGNISERLTILRQRSMSDATYLAQGVPGRTDIFAIAFGDDHGGVAICTNSTGPQQQAETDADIDTGNVCPEGPLSILLTPPEPCRARDRASGPRIARRSGQGTSSSAVLRSQRRASRSAGK